MRRFLIRLFVFLLPMILVVSFLEFKLSFTPNSYRIKRNLFEQQLDSLQVLVLGSSEVQSDVLPRYFTNRGFNLSNVAQPLYDDKELGQRYLHKMPQLHMAIIFVNYTSFYYNLADTREYWRDYYYYRFWGISNPQIPLVNIKKYSLIALYSWPEVRKIITKGFENDYTRGDKTLDSDGGLLLSPEELMPKVAITKSPQEGQAAVKFLGMFLRKNRFDENFSNLDGLIDSLNRNNIKVAIVTAPVTNEMYKYMMDTTYMDKSFHIKSDSAIDMICKKYSCRYYNFAQDSRFTVDDFSNETHLTGAGAVKFSKILDAEVIRPAF